MNARADTPLGLVHGMPNAEYQAGPGISKSGLSLIAQSPAHYFGRRLDPNCPPEPDSTAAQLFGTMAHCAILEPAEFDARFVVGPDVNRNTKVWHAFEDSLQPGQVGIKPGQREAAFAQAASVRALPEIGDLLARGRAEVSAYWIDSETGELCRCRPDYVHPLDDSRVILLDVKTYSDASPATFARQVARMGYHLQDAFYMDGYALASGQEVAGFLFVAVEDQYPFAACACMLDDDSRAKGRAEYRRHLNTYAECRRTNTWPGYSSGIELIRLPAWALSATPATIEGT